MRIPVLRYFVTAGALAVWLWTPPADAQGRKSAQQGPILAAKEYAPIRVEGAPGVTAATLRLTVDRAVTALDVHVYGVDGLQVTSAAHPVVAGVYAPGTVITLDVTYTAPVGESELVVAAQGLFRGAQRAVVKSFTVRQVDVPLRQKSGDKVLRDEGQGRRVRTMPAQAR